MKRGIAKTIALGAAAASLWITGAPVADAQDKPIPKPNLVMRQDIEVPGREVAMSFVEFPAGSAEVPHTHPAELFVFVREGEVSLESEGKPTTTYKVGDVFYVGAGKIHRVSNATGDTARTVAFFVAEKGKPLTAPVK